MRPEAQSEQVTDNEEESSETESQEVSEPVSEPEQETDMEQKTLVVYFFCYRNNGAIGGICGGNSKCRHL